MKNFHRRGYTLLEVIIAVFIGGLAAAGMTAFFVMSKDVTKSTFSQVSAKREGYAFAEMMAMRLREAHLVQILDAGDTMDVTRSDGSTFRVYFDSGDENPYTVENNTIKLIPNIEEPNVERVLVRYVAFVGTSPVFNRIDNYITIMLRVGDALDSPTMDAITGTGQQGFEIQSTVFLRNA